MKPKRPTHYQIRLEGCLAGQWDECFEGLSITLQNGQALLSGPVVNQAALNGLLKKVRTWVYCWFRLIESLFI